MSGTGENAGVEMHDAWVEVVRWEESSCVLELDACVHRSTGTPGVSRGTVWSQRVSIRCTGVRSEATGIQVGLELADGALEVPTGRMQNVLPVPFESAGPVRLELDAASGEKIVVDAESVKISELGEPKYLEEFAR